MYKWSFQSLRFSLFFILAKLWKINKWYFQESGIEILLYSMKFIQSILLKSLGLSPVSILTSLVLSPVSILKSLGLSTVSMLKYLGPSPVSILHGLSLSKIVSDDIVFHWQDGHWDIWQAENLKSSSEPLNGMKRNSNNKKDLGHPNTFQSCVCWPHPLSNVVSV